MTAPARAAGDVDTAVARADRQWCRDRADDPLDPERRAHLAAAVLELLTGEASPVDTAAAEASADPAELEQTRAELADARTRIEGLRAEIEGLCRQLAGERHWRTQLAQDTQAKLVSLEETRRERDEAYQLADRLRRDRDHVSQQLVDAEQRDQARAERARHRHAWEWQPCLQPIPLPCSCGMPWPRTTPPGTVTRSGRDKGRGGAT